MEEREEPAQSMEPEAELCAWSLICMGKSVPQAAKTVLQHHEHVDPLSDTHRAVHGA